MDHATKQITVIVINAVVITMACGMHDAWWTGVALALMSTMAIAVVGVEEQRETLDKERTRVALFNAATDFTQSMAFKRGFQGGRDASRIAWPIEHDDERLPAGAKGGDIVEIDGNRRLVTWYAPSEQRPARHPPVIKRNSRDDY